MKVVILLTIAYLLVVEAGAGNKTNVRRHLSKERRAQLHKNAIKNGAYVVNNTVHFNVTKFLKDNPNGADKCIFHRCDFICTATDFKRGYCHNNICICAGTPDHLLVDGDEGAADDDLEYDDEPVQEE